MPVRKQQNHPQETIYQQLTNNLKQQKTQLIEAETNYQTTVEQITEMFGNMFVELDDQTKWYVIQRLLNCSPDTVINKVRKEWGDD